MLNCIVYEDMKYKNELVMHNLMLAYHSVCVCPYHIRLNYLLSLNLTNKEVWLHKVCWAVPFGT